MFRKHFTPNISKKNSFLYKILMEMCGKNEEKCCCTSAGPKKTPTELKFIAFEIQFAVSILDINIYT